MYKKCNTEESVRRQYAMEQCLFEAMKRQPYAQISVSDLCAEAGVSRKSFYRYFGNKDGCLCAMIDHALFEMAREPEQEEEAEGGRQRLIQRMLGYWKENSELLKVIVDNHLINVLLERMMCHMKQEAREYLREFGVSEEAGSQELLFTLSGTVALLVSWYETEFEMTIQELVELLCRLIPG